MSNTSISLDTPDTYRTRIDEKHGRRLSLDMCNTLLYLEWEMGSGEYFKELFSNMKLCLVCEP
jgi:hypothetical protein